MNLHYMGVSISGGTPNRWFRMGNPIEMDDLVPSWKTAILSEQGSGEGMKRSKWNLP